MAHFLTELKRKCPRCESLLTCFLCSECPFYSDTLQKMMKMHRYVENESKNLSSETPRTHRERYGEFRCSGKECDYREMLPVCLVHREVYASRLEFLRAHPFYDFGAEEGDELDCV